MKTFKRTVRCFKAIAFISLLSVSSLFAENVTQWHLPEGATARIGRGWINDNVTFSPDGARLAVPSSIGMWIYDARTLEPLKLFTGVHYGSAFSPDGQNTC